MMIPVNNKTGIIVLLICLLTGFIPVNNYAEINCFSNLYLYSGSETLSEPDTEETFEEDTDIWMPIPAKAAMLSATLPGLGQIYNRKYWKVPIIYAGFGVIAYFMDMNSSNYQMFRKAYYYRIDGNPHTVDDFPNYSTDVLRRAMNYYRRNLEITYIVAAALYILNILDASVDAHLMDFDISEDLSLRMEPFIERNCNISQPGTGLKLTIRF